MPSDVSIYQQALYYLGIDGFAGFSDGTAEADIGNALYATIRDELLEQVPWRFAYEYGVQLTVLAATPPAKEWQYQFTLPSNLRTLIRVHDQGVPIPYQYIENDRILCGQSTNVYVDYIRDVSESVFPPSFVSALALKLAARVCVQLTGDLNLKRELDAQAREALLFAAFEDSKQQKTRSLGTPYLPR